MDFMSKLPQELINYIYEYNPEHREKMHWTLRQIRDNQFCEVCDKIIMKEVWSHRRSYEVCCSRECLDNYKGCRYYQTKWWM